MSNEKQKIWEMYVKKFLKSKEGTLKKPQTTVKRKGGNKYQLK